MEKPRSYDIKDAARHLGVAPSTLRYWESRNLISAERDESNDYRRYSLHDLIHASEIAFYRKLGVPVKELEGYRTLSAQGLDTALARTEEGIERRIGELEAMRGRLARQRMLNACAERLRQAGMRAATPAIESLSAIDYDSPEPWKLLVEEPWRYGVLIEADRPGMVHEAVVDAHGRTRGALWRREGGDSAATCRECLLKVAPDLETSNAEELFDQARSQGLAPARIVGSYLLTASDHDGRWDLHHAWIVGRPIGRSAASAS